MLKPPQLASLNMEKQKLHYELLTLSLPSPWARKLKRQLLMKCLCKYVYLHASSSLVQILAFMRCHVYFWALHTEDMAIKSVLKVKPIKL